MVQNQYGRWNPIKVASLVSCCPFVSLTHSINERLSEQAAMVQGLFSNPVYKVVFKACGILVENVKIRSGPMAPETIGKKGNRMLLTVSRTCSETDSSLPLLTAVLAATPRPPIPLPVRPLMSALCPHPVYFHDESETRRIWIRLENYPRNVLITLKHYTAG